MEAAGKRSERQYKTCILRELHQIRRKFLTYTQRNRLFIEWHIGPRYHVSHAMLRWWRVSGQRHQRLGPFSRCCPDNRRLHGLLETTAGCSVSQPRQNTSSGRRMSAGQAACAGFRRHGPRVTGGSSSRSSGRARGSCPSRMPRAAGSDHGWVAADVAAGFVLGNRCTDAQVSRGIVVEGS